MLVSPPPSNVQNVDLHGHIKTVIAPPVERHVENVGSLITSLEFASPRHHRNATIYDERNHDMNRDMSDRL